MLETMVIGVIFLQVFLLELRDCILCVIGVICGRVPEILLNLLSSLIFRFLSEVPMLVEPPQLEVSDLPLVRQVVL